MDPQERRRQYRIDDEVILKIKKLNPSQIDGKEIEFLQGLASEAKENIIKHEHQLKANIDLITTKSKVIGDVLKQLYEKIVELDNTVNQDSEKGVLDDPPTQVDISTGGVGFAVKTRYPKGTIVQVEIYFLPNFTKLSAIGEILNCVLKKKRIPHGQTLLFKTGLIFRHMTETDQEQLAKYVQRKKKEALQNTRKK